MHRMLASLIVLSSCCFAQDGLDIFSVGNSLTDGLVWPAGDWKNGAFFPYIESGGKSLPVWGKATFAGAPLGWTWNEKPESYQSLTNNGWDVLTLQPYSWPLYDNKYPGTHTYDWGDVTNAANFIRLAVQSNPDMQVYIYSHWPAVANHWRYNQYLEMTNPATGQRYTYEEATAAREAARAAFDYTAEWDKPYTNYFDFTTRSREYFDALVRELEKKNLPLTKPIRMIPAGDVLYALHQKMRNGGIFGYTNIVQVYQDVPHLRPGVGRLIMAATWYAALFQESPEGLDYTIYNCADSNEVVSKYGSLDAPYYIEISPDFAAAVHSTAWEVVSAHPYAGIAPLDHDRDGLPNEWERQYFGNPTNADPQAIAVNGVNTLLEAYIAGLDPAGADTFRIQLFNGGFTWSAVSGRLYDVYYSAGLLDGFTPFQTDIPWNANSFTNITEGFYKLRIRLP